MTSKLRIALAVLALAAVPTARAAAQLPDAATLKVEARASVDAHADRLGRIADAIFSYSELGFHEVKTVALVTKTLEDAGFRVERGLVGMPTAYRATYGSGSPVIGLMADYDCIPGASQKPGVLEHDPVVAEGPGHGEGHNTNPPTVMGAAIAMKELMAKYHIPGTLVVFGGPAEELGQSRGYMVKGGLFDGVDAVMDAHIGTRFGTSYGLSNLAIASVQWTFHGQEAHSATSPWAGKSALDGVELMDAGMNYLREHLPLEMRFHYVITDGGEQPNVVPAKATVWYYLRHTDFAKLEDLLDKTRTVAQSAAAMSQTTVTEHILASSWPLNGNKELATLLQSNIEEVGMPHWSTADVAFAEAFQKAMGKDVVGLPTEVTPIRHLSQGSSSSDVGDVTWIVPYARLSFPSQVEGTLGNHHWSAAIAVATPVAHKGLVVGAKALAGTLVDLYTDPANLRRIKADFAQQVAGVQWRSLIPDGQEPPIEINADKMAKWAPLLAPHYYDPDSPKTFLEEWGVPYPPKGR